MTTFPACSWEASFAEDSISAIPPMTNLFMNMLDVAGVHQDKLGDSNGKLDYLSL